MNAGVRYWIMPDRLAVWTSEISRGGFNNFWKGGAENTLEILGGVEYKPVNYVTLHLGGGSALADGTGGTKQRILLSAKFIPIPPPRPDFVVEAEEELKTEPVIEVAIEEFLTVEKKWKEGELARVEDEAIVIRDPIQFEFNTANILPESLPTLHFVAKLMNENGRIGHVVIEGHTRGRNLHLQLRPLDSSSAVHLGRDHHSGCTPGPSLLPRNGRGRPPQEGYRGDRAGEEPTRRLPHRPPLRELDAAGVPGRHSPAMERSAAKVRTPEDIARKMAVDEQRRRTERNIEGLGQDDDVTPVPVPAAEEEEPEPVRIDESDEEAAPEDPAEDPAETEE